MRWERGMPLIRKTIIVICLVYIIAFPLASEANADVTDIIFNVVDGDIVQLDDFLLVAELSNDLIEKYEGFKLLIDGEEVPYKFLEEQGLLTFLPGEEFDVGKHLVELVGVNSDVEEILTEFGFGTVLRKLEKFINGDLDIEDALLALGGELAFEADFNKLEGIGASILEREARDTLSQLTSSLATDQWGIDIMMLLDSEQGKYTQIYDRFKVGITTDNLDVLLGETFPKYSDYTITGRRLRGLSWVEDLGDWDFEGTWGKALKRVDSEFDQMGGILNPGTPGLDVYAFRVATDKKLPLRTGLTFLGGDKTTYGTDYEFPGADNRVLSFDAAYEIGDNFSFTGEYAFADSRDDDAVQSSNAEAKKAELKYKTDNNTLSFSYKDIEPDFDSFGLNSIRTNVSGFEIEDRFSFDGGFSGNLSYESYRDNLDSASENTRWTDLFSGRVTYRPQAFPGGLDFTYRKYDRSNDLTPEESGAYSITNDSMSFSGFVRGDIFGARHNLRVTYSDRSSDDNVRLLTMSESSDLSCFWNVRFDSGLSLNLGFGKQQREANGTSQRDSMRYDLRFSYQLDEGRLLLTGGWGYTSLDGNEIFADSDRLNARLGLRWKLTPFYSVEASYQRLDFDDEGDGANNYEDDAFKIKLVRSF
jgi:hypothetical protein